MLENEQPYKLESVYLLTDQVWIDFGLTEEFNRVHVLQPFQQGVHVCLVTDTEERWRNDC